MRSNGLTAEDYAPLAELERSLAADALLALREAGVAAYAVPTDGATRTGPGDDPRPGPGGDQPERSRLFADRTALERARAVVRDLAPDVAPAADISPVDEVAWQQIVSGFSATAPEPDPDVAPPGDRTGPGAAGSDEAPAGPARPGDPAGRGDRTTPPPPEPHPLIRDEDEHFVPAPPPPPPRLDVVSRLAWSGVFGGPLMLLAAALVGWAPPRALVLLCVLGFVGGMVTLVVRMKDRPPTDDGPDNGAVV